jgi:hypothetical protein
MDKLTELCEFLAWVQDNYTEVGDDDWDSILERDGGGISRSYTRQDIVTHYLMEKGVKHA